MSADGLKQLGEAIGPRVTREERSGLTKFYGALIAQGSALDLARQVYVDREQFEPTAMPVEPQLSDPYFLAKFAKGASVPPELANEFPAFLVAHSAYRLALSDNERRLRCTMDAWRKLKQSEQESDRRMASAFARWHLEHWRIAEVPAPAEQGLDQPFEKQLMAAVRRRVR